MRVQDVLGSPPFVVMGVTLARLMPHKLGHWLAGRVARNMARRRNALFVTLRGNLGHVVPSATAAELDAMTERAIHHLGCAYLDMFRVRLPDLKTGRVPVRIDAAQWARAEAVMRDPRGTVVVGPHMSNFDLAAQWFAAQGLEIQVLSLASPDMGTRVVNLLRRKLGMQVTPIDMDTLRESLQRLRSGGIVMTGVDRPVSPDDEPIPFFGAPARLPTGHVRLALQSNARVVVACCRQAADGVYEIEIAPPLEMEHVGRRAEDVRHNAQRVLAVIEALIRQAPDQWLMLVPVWRPEDQPAQGETTVAADSLAPAAN